MWDEDVSGVESDGTRQEPKADHHDKRVSKVEDSWYEVFYLKLQIGRTEKYTHVSANYMYIWVW